MAQKGKKRKTAKKVAKSPVIEQKKPDPAIEKQRKYATYSNWEANQVDLAEAFIEFVKGMNRRPTVAELETLTGLSYNTVRSHLKTLEKTKFAERWESFRVLSEQVILAQAVNAMKGGKGSAQSAKLFLEIVEGFRPGLKVDLEANVKISEMSLEELMARREEHGKLINSKLLRFTRDNRSARKTG